MVEHIPEWRTALQELARIAREALITVPDMSAIPALFPHHVVPWHLASDLVLTGRSLTAAEAHAAGLVSRLAEPEQLGPVLDQLLGELRALSPTSLRLTKQALRLARPPVDFAAVAAAERHYVHNLLDEADAVEGLTAFLEKRPPKWREPGGPATHP